MEKGKIRSLRSSIRRDGMTLVNRIVINIPKGIINVLATITKNTKP